MTSFIHIIGDLIVAATCILVAMLLMLQTTIFLETTERATVELLGLDRDDLTRFGKAWRLCLLPVAAVVVDWLLKAIVVCGLAVALDRHYGSK